MNFKKSLLNLFFIPFLLVSCSNDTLLKKNIFSFSTVFSLNFYNTTNEKILKIEALINKYNKLFDAFKSYSNVNNIYTINETNNFVKVDKNLFEALKLANKYYAETNKFFNPFLGELTFEYKKMYEKHANGVDFSFPSEEFINTSLENIKNFSLEFDDNNLSVKRNGEAKIDLGAFAKGYVVDQVSLLAKENNLPHYFVNAGNSSSYFTSKPDDSSYKVGIKYLDKKLIECKNISVGVSSIFEQNIKDENGKIIYSHIIDPFTGKPKIIYDFAVIKAESATLSDVFSTVLMLLDKKEDIINFNEKYNFEYLIYKDGKEVLKSENFELLDY